MDYIKEAKKLGFSNTAIMDTKKLVFKPEYRKFCEENQCGCYNVNPACPPECGTVESMKQRVFAYEKALILQTIQSKDMDYKMAKLAHNKLTEQLASKIMESGNTDLLIMSAGPYRHYCRSLSDWKGIAARPLQLKVSCPISSVSFDVAVYQILPQL